MDPNLWNVQNVLFDVFNFQKQDQLPEAKNQAVKTFKFTLTTEMKSYRDVVASTNSLVIPEATIYRFRKRQGKMWTYLSDASLTISQIDYVLVNKKWTNCIHNTEPYNSFCSTVAWDQTTEFSSLK